MLDGETLGTFEAEFPFNFDGIGSFDEFEIAGRVGIAAAPDITLQAGWDDSGLYLDVGASRIAAKLTGVGEASGYAFETFGVGAGATVTANPYLDLEAIDRARDGRIRLGDVQLLADDLLAGEVSLVIPRLDTVAADLHGDLIFGFLDYVDVDPDLPNQKHGGDPFIVRGEATLEADLGGDGLTWAFSDFGLANPDIDHDGQDDYTLGVLAENSLQFGQSIINAIEVPDFVKNLLGDFSFTGESIRSDPLERPRGFLPETADEATEGTLARQAVNGHLADAVEAAETSGEEIDIEAFQTAASFELAAWMEGAPTAAQPISVRAEGEDPQQASIVARIEALDQYISNQPDPTETNAFERGLLDAVNSYLQWEQFLASTGFEPEDVVSPATLTSVKNGLVAALDHAIHRSHVEAISLHLSGTAPLNHVVAGGVVTERGVLDRAVDAVRSAQTAEYLQLATATNELSVVQALEDLVVKVVVDSAELRVDNEDNVISGDNDPMEDNRVATLDIQGGWQIKLPPTGEQPDIDRFRDPDYQFSETFRDAGGNLVVTMAGAGNNNIIAGEPLPSLFDPIQTSFIPVNDYLGITRAQQLATYLAKQQRPDLLPIKRAELDSNGTLQTSVRLGEGDTFAQVQYEVGLPLIGLVNDTTNVIGGRPTLEMFAGTLREDVLNRDTVTVRQGQAVSLEARVRRGNGPLVDGALSFALDGPGVLDQTTSETTLIVPRTPADGFAKIIYESAAGGRRCRRYHLGHAGRWWSHLQRFGDNPDCPQ